MEKNEAIEKDTAVGPRKGDKVDKALGLTANALVLALVFLPQLERVQNFV